MSRQATIVWFRQDLRLADNPALRWAAAREGPVIPVFIWNPREHGAWPPGAARRWWLHRSLAALGDAMDAAGNRLILRAGDSLEVLRELTGQVGAAAVTWNRRYEPAPAAHDRATKAALRDDGLEVRSHNAHLLYEPWAVKTKTGGPYKVFTPFWRTCGQLPEPDRPAPAVRRLPAPRRWPTGEDLAGFALEPTIDWAGGIAEAWTPGEAGAAALLKRFCRDAVNGYAERRDRPDLDGTSRLSPHLYHGEIGPRQVYHAVRRRQDRLDDRAARGSAQKVIDELGWREFAYHVLFHHPRTTDAPLQPRYAAFPWRRDDALLRAWQRGRTGYPIVDAGMRQLWHTGWMHNRVRMIVASFLVKDLLIDWVEGARWFWDTLVDADLASNTLGWQWAGGCGADAAPYFRIFNPVLQGRKFDPEGAFVRRWVPELKDVPDRQLHCPWEAAPAVLGDAGVRLGETYPEPIVDHRMARDRALDALAALPA